VNRTPARLRGVYYLFLGDVVIYVGSSVNILLRVGQHVRDRDKEFDSFAYCEMLTASAWDIEEFEIQEIRRLRPRMNVKFNEDSKHDRPVPKVKVSGPLCSDCGLRPPDKHYFVCKKCVKARRRASPYSWQRLDMSKLV
jgi:hypothetical protein